MEKKKIREFQDLEVWQAAHQLALEVYRISALFPAEERFGLTAQMRRSTLSIPANIAEGFGRRSQKEKLNFYNIARGSLAETTYYLIFARDMGYLSSAETLLDHCDHISRMLYNLSARIQSPSP